MGTSVRSSNAPALIADFFQQGLKLGGVHRVLRTIRKHLGMDVAFVSRFREKDRLLEEVDTDTTLPVYQGLAIPLQEGYCGRMVRGELPELIADTTGIAPLVPPEVITFPIGAHLSVPIRLYSGEVYGTLCCFSTLPDLTLGERDVKMMRAFAEVLAAHIEEDGVASKARGTKVASVQAAMTGSSPRIVYQPIYSLKAGTLAGMECLSRFDADKTLSPGQWFELADEVDLRQDLEMVAIRRALQTLDRFPAWVYFGVNSSPQTVLSHVLAQALEGVDLSRVVVEITEHAIVTDYRPLSAALRPLREKGLRIAIDDAGAGYASMRHIVNLHPDYIKLDMSLVQAIDRDPNRRALAKALISFSQEIGSRIIAEGIETRQELDILCQLGVDMGQGYFLKEPVPLDTARDAALHRFSVESDQIHLGLPD